MKPSIIRFTGPERLMHNIVMFSFVLLLITGLSMIYFNIGGEHRETREFLRTVHQAVAVLFVVGPLLVLLFGGVKIWIENLKIVFNYRKDDLRWLLLTPLEAFVKTIVLPPQDKFNGGQKLWILLVLGSSLVFVVTGAIIWYTTSAILALLIHTTLTFIMIPALSGHLYMALLNPDTRQGITAIIDGEVDAHWAQEHHPIWMERTTKERVLKMAQPEQVEKGETDPFYGGS